MPPQWIRSNKDCLPTVCGVAIAVALMCQCAAALGPPLSCRGRNGNGIICSMVEDSVDGYVTAAISLNGVNANASGPAATAMGIDTTASGQDSVAMGWDTVASGNRAVAMGQGGISSGDRAVAMGFYTNASGSCAVAMGQQIEASADNALVNSGEIHGSNIGFFADERLATDVHPANPAALLGAVNRLEVVTHTPSANLCAHRNWGTAECSGSRSVGLLAQQVAQVLPAATRSASSLTLATPQTPKSSGAAKSAGEILEHVKDLQSLDVHTLIAHLVGAVQAQSAQIEMLKQENKKQSEQIATLIVKPSA